MSLDFTACKNLLGKYEQKYFARLNLSYPLPVPPDYYYVTAGVIAREFLFSNQGLSPVDIISRWFSMLIYHLWDEQYRHW
jgi:hypothetical protein